MKQLLFRPLPSATGESWPGYVLRIAQRNALVGAEDVARRFGWPLEWTLDGPNPQCLVDLQLAEEGHALIASGRGKTASTRYCPICLHPDSPDWMRVWNAQWDSPITFHCEHHGCLLTDRCLTCSARVSHRRQHFDRCDCGAPFHRAKVVAAPEWVRQLGVNLGVEKRIAIRKSPAAQRKERDLNQLLLAIRALTAKLYPGASRLRLLGKRGDVEVAQLLHLRAWLHRGSTSLAYAYTHACLRAHREDSSAERNCVLVWHWLPESVRSVVQQPDTLRTIHRPQGSLRTATHSILSARTAKDAAQRLRLKPSAFSQLVQCGLLDSHGSFVGLVPVESLDRLADDLRFCASGVATPGTYVRLSHVLDAVRSEPLGVMRPAYLKSLLSGEIAPIFLSDDGDNPEYLFPAFPDNAPRWWPRTWSLKGHVSVSR